MRLPHGGEGLRMRRMTVLWTFRSPFMGRSVRHQLLRNEWLNLTTIVPATAYYRGSYTKRYSRSMDSVFKNNLSDWQRYLVAGAKFGHATTTLVESQRVKTPMISSSS